VLGLAAGSDRFTGAAVLAAGGAIHGGAGMVRLVSAAAAAALVRQSWPEVVITTTDSFQTGTPRSGEQILEAAGRVQAWVAGPGMGTGDTSAGLLQAVLATDLPVLVDADGITMLAEHSGLLPRSAATLITPHAGELARLLGADRADIEAHRLRFATRAEGLDDSDRAPGGRRGGTGEPDRDTLAGHGRIRGRSVRPGRSAACAGSHASTGGSGGRLPARHRRPPGRRWCRERGRRSHRRCAGWRAHRFLGNHRLDPRSDPYGYSCGRGNA
jgi:hypothetical protein